MSESIRPPRAERFDRSWWHYADDCPAAPRAEGLDDDIRRDIRAAQVQIAEATWRLGRDHPEFHALQRALSRLNRASRPSDERVPESEAGE